jgi:KipI family sensor histidine kinase inhibitor
MQIRASGTAALLVECGSLDEVLATYAAIREAVDGGRVPGVVDVVPAARTVLLSLDPRVSDPTVAAAALAGLDPAGTREEEPGERDVLELPVTYDGEDLPDVAAILGCSPEEVVRRHTSGLWTVAFCGFAPGFGYLTADEGEWDVPRRDTPRKVVPAGAVGLAGEFTGAYPKPSPGGWQLIGRTDAPLFDLDRDPPALFSPRRRVRFVAVEAQ